jgi:hypothetical protein
VRMHGHGHSERESGLRRTCEDARRAQVRLVSGDGATGMGSTGTMAALLLSHAA